MRNLAQGKEIMKFDWILSEKGVLEDLTLQGLMDFTQCTRTCANLLFSFNFSKSWVLQERGTSKNYLFLTSTKTGIGLKYTNILA